MVQILTQLRRDAKVAKANDDREAIQAVLERVYERKRVLWKEIEALTNVHTGLEERRAVIDSETMFPTDDDITPEKVMALNWEEVSGKLYDRLSKWFYTFKYLGNSGYVPDTQQASIQCRFYKDQPVEPQVAEVMQFVPYMKLFEPSERADDFGPRKYLAIMEHTLSAGASFSIYIRPDDTSVLYMMRYHRFEILQEFEDVESCLRYVHEHHPYELPESESCREDDENW